MGKTAKEIARIYFNKVKSVSPKNAKALTRLDSVKTLTPGEQFSFGDFKIMPITVDHSAFDAYAFRIEAEHRSVFHTGDFRIHGFRSGKFPILIDKYVKEVEYVVCEATNIDRPASTQQPERDLQDKYISAFKENKYNVVYVSSTNVDRLFALYRAAIKAKRPFYVDTYQKNIMDAVTKDPLWSKSDFFQYQKPLPPIELQEEGPNFRINDKFKNKLEELGYVLIARGNEKFDRLIEQMPSVGRKVYLSMWDGYINPSIPAYNPRLAKSVEQGYVPLHTSGHCDMESLESLFTQLKPSAIIPIHTDNPQKFAEKFYDKWPVLLLEDGESFHVGGSVKAEIIAYDDLQEPIENVNPNELPWWALDVRQIGWFSDWDEAERTLKHVCYAPSRVFAYMIETSDMDRRTLYDHDFSILSEYVEGGHEPGGKFFQQSCGLKPGDKVYALHDLEFFDFLNPAKDPLPSDTIIPCEVIGPITEDYLKNELKESVDFDPEELGLDTDLPETSWDYCQCFHDWEMDAVIVRPLLDNPKSRVFKIRPTKLYKYIDLKDLKKDKKQ